MKRRVTVLLFLCCTLACFAGDPDKNTFWTISSSGEVNQWKLENNSVSGGEKYESAGAGSTNSGLAWCSALSKKPQCHYLYNNLSEGLAFAGSNGEKTASIPKNSQSISNMGGYGKYLYVQETTGSSPDQPAALLCYEGSAFKRIAVLGENEMFGAADIAVDTLGRAWVLVAPRKDYETRKLELRCYDPSGKKITSVPVNGISPMNAFGLMLIDGKFYVGYGSVNEDFPDQLVPLVYEKDKLKPGTTIAFEHSCHDLASFYPGCPKFPTGAPDSSNQKN